MLNELVEEHVHEEEGGFHFNLGARVQLYANLYYHLVKVLVNKLYLVKVYQSDPEYAHDVRVVVQLVYQTLIVNE